MVILVFMIFVVNSVGLVVSFIEVFDVFYDLLWLWLLLLWL